MQSPQKIYRVGGEEAERVDATTSQPLRTAPTPDGEIVRALAIICSRGNLDLAYVGLILGNIALGEGIETHLFFTFQGFDLIAKSRMHTVHLGPAGNATMHVPGSDRHMPQVFAPAMADLATKILKRRVAELGVPDVPAFLDRIVAAGGRLWACKMSADMMKVDVSDLRDDVEGIITATDFLGMTEGAQLLFI